MRKNTDLWVKMLQKRVFTNSRRVRRGGPWGLTTGTFPSHREGMEIRQTINGKYRGDECKILGERN